MKKEEERSKEEEDVEAIPKRSSNRRNGHGLFHSCPNTRKEKIMAY